METILQSSVTCCVHMLHTMRLSQEGGFSRLQVLWFVSLWFRSAEAHSGTYFGNCWCQSLGSECGC